MIVFNIINQYISKYNLNSKNMDNRRIQNPTVEKLGLLLIPAMIALILTFFLRSFPWWNVAMFTVSIVAYFAAVTYYCVKQKCYGQLLRNYLSLVFCIIILMVIHYI